MSGAALHVVPRKPAKISERPGPPNNIARLLLMHGLSEVQLFVQLGISQSYVNKVKNRRCAPQVNTAWKFVIALRELTGKPLSFEAVFPMPEVRR